MGSAIVPDVGLDDSLLDAAANAPDDLLEDRAVEAINPQPNPFALSDDHEFKDAAPPKPVNETNPRKPITSVPAAPIESVAEPGSPESLYRHCPCVGVPPGQVCPVCRGTRWIKPCPKCDGSGRVAAPGRNGSMRTQPCGWCMTRGMVPASKAEVHRAESLVDNSSPNVEAEHQKPEIHRAARLPGIGAISRKRKKRRGRPPKNR